MKRRSKLTTGSAHEVNRELLADAMHSAKVEVSQISGLASILASLVKEECENENLATRYCVEYSTAEEIIALCKRLLTEIDKSTRGPLEFSKTRH